MPEQEDARLTDGLREVGMRVSAEVLDTLHGRPADEVVVRLELARGREWCLVDEASTDHAGVVEDMGGADLPGGSYRLIVEAGRYYATLGVVCAQAEVVVAFTVRDPETTHQGVPVLLAPFGYATYTGVRQ